MIEDATSPSLRSPQIAWRHYVPRICQNGEKNEAGNILKTKGRKSGFRKNEAENILQTKQLTQSRGDSQKDLTICPREETQNRPS